MEQSTQFYFQKSGCDIQYIVKHFSSCKSNAHGDMSKTFVFIPTALPLSVYIFLLLFQCMFHHCYRDMLISHLIFITLFLSFYRYGLDITKIFLYFYISI